MLQGAWEKMQPAFEHLVNVLRHEAFISGLDDLPTNYVLAPAAIYLARQGGQFPTDTVKRRFIRWIYLAGLWARYSGASETKLQQDVALVAGRDVDPTHELEAAILRQRGRVTLEAVVVKTLAGFLNAAGGTLLIGVDDGGKLVGLADDYRSLGKQDRDGFELHLQALVRDLGESAASSFLTVNFHEVDGQDICQVTVEPSDHRIYVEHQNEASFYLRVGNGTRALPVNEVVRRVQQRGPDFLRLANALSALYPRGSDEKRLLDAMLLAAPR